MCFNQLRSNPFGTGSRGQSTPELIVLVKRPAFGKIRTIISWKIVKLKKFHYRVLSSCLDESESPIFRSVMYLFRAIDRMTFDKGDTVIFIQVSARLVRPIGRPGKPLMPSACETPPGQRH